MAQYEPVTSNLCVFSSVGDSATSVIVVADNPKRHGGSIVNASTAILYLRTDGGTANSTTGYNVALEEGDYWEIPAGYTGPISGIWASDAGGSANVAQYM